MTNLGKFYTENPNLRIEEAVKIVWKGEEDKRNLWWQGHWITHNELLPLIAFYKEKFAATGFSEGQRIAILLPNSPTFIAIMFATWELGGAICPLNARAGVAQLVDTIKKLDVAFIITTEENVAKAGELAQRIPIIPVPLFGKTEAEWHARIGTQESRDIAVIFSTSGTSGLPKAVPLTHSNIIANGVGQVLHFDDFFVNDNIFLFILPNFHTYGLNIGCIIPFLYCIPTVVVPNFVPVTNTIKALQESGANFLIVVPTILAFIVSALEKANIRLSGINFIIAGGDKLNTALDDKCAEYLGCRIVEGYGLTECSPTVAVAESLAKRKLGTIGRALANIEIEVRDREGNKLDLHDEGVLWLKGPSIVKSYFRDEENTRERFKDGWFNTGDVVRIDNEGYISVVDRATDIIIVGGFNVYPQEVEAVLSQHPAVAQAVCVGEKNSVTGEIVKAFIILKPNATVTAKELVKFSKEHLSHYKVPRKIGFVESFPLSPAGKILRRELRKIDIRKLEQSQENTPSTENRDMRTFYKNHLDMRIEEAVSLIWRERLGSKCLWWEGDWITAATFADLVTSYRDYLKDAGFKDGNRCIALLPNCPSMAAIALATWLLGGTICPQNARAGNIQLSNIIQSLDASCVFTIEENMSRADIISSGVPIVPVPLFGLPKAQITVRQGTPGSRDTAVIFSTSGSSGLPKFVPLTHKNIICDCCGPAERINGFINDQIIFLWILPNFHTFGLNVGLLLPLLYGYPTVAIQKFIPVEKTIAQLEASGANFYIIVPTMLSFLLATLEKKKKKLDNILYVISGGDKLDIEMEKKSKEYLGCEILEGYGLTECSPIVSVGGDGNKKRLGTVGQPFSFLELSIRDKDGNELELHEEGALWLRGESVTKSYFRDEESTRERFKDGWFNTGDIVRIDKDGFITIVDRATDIIIVGGFNVYPQEVEAVLMQHPDIASAVCIGEKNTITGEIVKAFVILKPGAKVTENDIIRFAKAQLSHYKTPRKVIFLDSFPLSPAGKVFRRALKNI
ncbi:MAG: AMP-binding protein [Synergistaceae bacterium]|nr:AMP-binding protein [Synergistaceae bacterium]